jgi:CcmD family protein
MNATRYLYAAYIATWLIHGVYIGSLVRRYRALRQRMKDLGKSSR